MTVYHSVQGRLRNWLDSSRCDKITNRLFFLTITPLLILISIGITIGPFVPSIFSSGARSDWSDFYDNVQGAPQCWQDGYDDGQNSDFSQNRHKECQFNIEEHPDFGEPYYEAFIHGCRHAGNSNDICERSTDD
jgi:hypothetical protein